MRKETSRRGPETTIRLFERSLRKRKYLEKDERILEWKQGRAQRWLINGADQPVPKFHGLERMPIYRGVTTLSYSPARLFIYGTDRLEVADLGFIIHIWYSAPRSVCVIYSTFDEQSSGSLVSIRWDSDEIEPTEELVRFADKLRVRARDRRASLPAEWQARIESRLSEITESGRFEAELALIDEDAAVAFRLRPRTVVGRYLWAGGRGMTEEMRQFNLNGGKPGWNDDEPGVVAAASELAARRYFGPRASAQWVAEAVAQIQKAERTGAERNPPGKISEKSHVEAVIRYAAGEHDLVLEGVPPAALFHIRVALTILVIKNFDLTFEANKLICDAEALAFERGLNPPLADGTA
jgi:hypothetical protein